jgi:ABC-2 type transport system permease protein
MRRHIANILRLGVKELRSLRHDVTMVVLILYTFTVAIYLAGTAMPDTLHRAPIAIVDEDASVLSGRIAAGFHPPQFLPPANILPRQEDPGLDAGSYTFVLHIPPNFQRDVLALAAPSLQLDIDATRMSQAFAGNDAIGRIALGEVDDFMLRHQARPALAPELVLRARFNPALAQAPFGALMETVNNVTMLSIILTGAALIREREHGTIEHLLVMPLTPTEIMLAKIWSMALVVLLAVSLSLTLVIRGLLQVPIEGSLALFLTGAALHLFATTSMGIFMATLARSMPQFGLLAMLTLIPLQMLSGGVTPRESMPPVVRHLMSLSPTTHFTELSQAILFRGAGIGVVWQPFLWLLLIGGVLFLLSLLRFRKAIGRMT